MAEAGAEPGKPPPVASLERALDQVCDFLSRSEQTARVRALVIEARRLRNVVGNWRSIAPDADVREEMIARVLRLANDAEDVVAAERANAARDDASASGGGGNAATGRGDAHATPGRTLAIGLRLGPGPQAGGQAPAARNPPGGGGMFLTTQLTTPKDQAAAANVGGADGGRRPEAASTQARMLDLGATIASPSVLGGSGRHDQQMPIERVIIAPAREIGVHEAQPGPARADAQRGSPLERSLATTFASPPSLVLDTGRGASGAAAALSPAARANEPVAAKSLTGAFPSPPSLVFERVVPPQAQADVSVREAPPAAPAPAAPSAAPKGFERSLTGTFASPPSLVFERVVPPQALPRAVEVRPAPRGGLDETFAGPPSLHIEHMRPPPDAPDNAGPESELYGPGHADAISVRSLPLPDDLDPRIVMIRDPYSPQADAYRTLRRKLSSGTAKTIAVTSASPGEGKTTCAINLALALRETVRGRILLVEANIRTPGIAAALKFEPPRCFTEQLLRHRDDKLAPWIVVEQAAPKGAAQPADELTDATNEKSSPSGNSRSPEHQPTMMAPVHILAVDPRSERPPMLDSVAFSMGMESLKRAGYTYIIVDTPPVLSSMDMNVVGDSVDGVLLTSQVKKSTRKSLRSAIEQLRPAPVLGVVLLEP